MRSYFTIAFLLLGLFGFCSVSLHAMQDDEFERTLAFCVADAAAKKKVFEEAEKYARKKLYKILNHRLLPLYYRFGSEGFDFRKMQNVLYKFISNDEQLSKAYDLWKQIPREYAALVLKKHIEFELMLQGQDSCGFSFSSVFSPQESLRAFVSGRRQRMGRILNYITWRVGSFLFEARRCFDRAAAKRRSSSINGHFSK